MLPSAHNEVLASTRRSNIGRGYTMPPLEKEWTRPGLESKPGYDAVDNLIGWIDSDPGDDDVDTVVYGLNIL